MRERRVEAQHRAGSSNADDHLAILGAPCGELEVAAADQVKTAGIFTLTEKCRLSRQADGARNEFEISQDCASQRAEPTGPTIRASGTADWRLAIDALLPSCRRRLNS